MPPLDLAELAARAAHLPEERRTRLLAELPALLNIRFAQGVVEGLVHAAQVVNGDTRVATDLHDCAAVAAAQLLEMERLYEEADKLTDTPTARAQIEAEIRRIESGQVKMVPFEDIVSEVLQMEAAKANRNGQNTDSNH